MTEKQSPAASQFEDREDDAKYNAPRVAMTLADFELVQRLGDGSFSQVVLGRHRHTHKQYAIKIIDKHLILRHKQTKYIQNERYLLDKINSDSVSDLYFTFQDEHSLYLGLEYCPNGELYDQIHRRKKLEVQDVQFYAAEMVLMLRLLQQEQVIHRDLKPENLLLSASGHLKLIDFGSAKWLGENPLTESDHQQHKPAPRPSFMKPSPTPPASTSLVADSTTDSAAATSSASAVASAATPATSAGVAATAVPTANSDGKAQRSANAPSGKDTASAASPQDSTPTVHITGSSAAMPEAELPAKSLQEPTDKPQSTASGELPGITARSSSQRATSFVGTADYVSPEVLNNLPVTYASDLWSLGCVVYQMLVGATPFKAATEYLTFQRISAGQMDVPAFVPAPAQDMLRKLLHPDATRRLGADSLQNLMKHPFFEKIDWDNLRQQQAPKFLPPIRNTAADNAVDWELRSLAAALPRQGGAVGNVSGHAGSAGHANAQGMQSQDSGPDSNAYMAAAAQMHAIIRSQNETNF